jgi:hypothetical protein
MGTLVAMRYPTKLALGAADHTYVKCANGGRAWSCWGGKTGGTELNRDTGSTLRADAIAGHDEKAGIRCYLINGVCHQCANRILIATDTPITVRGARGYWISVARFGVYGRPRGRGLFAFCDGAFNQYPGISGDLPECASPPGVAQPKVASVQPDDKAYVDKVRNLYDSEGFMADPLKEAGDDQIVDFMMTQFDYRLQFARGLDLKPEQRGAVIDARAQLERDEIDLERMPDPTLRDLAAFAELSDELTLDFQRRMADLLGARNYRIVFEMKAGDFIRLADPAVVGGAAAAPR